MIVFQVSLNLIQWKKYWKSIYYLNEESDYSEENTSDNTSDIEVFAPPFFNNFSFSLNRKVW